MLAQLVDQDIVHLDSTISDFFNAENPPAFSIYNPFFSSSSPYSYSPSFQSLAQHRSGLSREPFGSVYNPNATQIFDVLSVVPLQYPPFTTPHYSNLALGLLVSMETIK
jgi:CubicO group peptidase (beta-lactamase class C family)